MKVRNILIIFIFSGFWHGANWTFIIWGALNAIYFLPLLLTNNNRKNLETIAQGKYFPTIKEFSHMLLTFALTVFAWIFFRAENIGHALSYLSDIFSTSLFQIPEIMPFQLIILIVIFILIEWIGREGQYAISHLGATQRVPVRWAMYFVIIAAIFIFSGKEQQFIYFQF